MIAKKTNNNEDLKWTRVTHIENLRSLILNTQNNLYKKVIVFQLYATFKMDTESFKV